MTLDRRGFLAALSALAVTLTAVSRVASAAQPAPFSADNEVDHIGMLVYRGFTALDFVGPPRPQIAEMLKHRLSGFVEMAGQLGMRN
jgi:hypothetical protein